MNKQEQEDLITLYISDLKNHVTESDARNNRIAFLEELKEKLLKADVSGSLQISREIICKDCNDNGCITCETPRRLQ